MTSAARRFTAHEDTPNTSEIDMFVNTGHRRRITEIGQPTTGVETNFYNLLGERTELVVIDNWMPGMKVSAE